MNAIRHLLTDRDGHLWCRVESTVFLVVGVAVGFLAAVSVQNLNEPMTMRVQHSSWTQPYGGCEEAWQAPRSPGARACRRHGWTVRGRFVLNERSVVRHLTLRPCPVEDSRNCYWRADRRGNGRGHSFVTVGSHRWVVRFR